MAQEAISGEAVIAQLRRMLSEANFTVAMLHARLEELTGRLSTEKEKPND